MGNDDISLAPTPTWLIYVIWVMVEPNCSTKISMIIWQTHLEGQKQDLFDSLDLYLDTMLYHCQRYYRLKSLRTISAVLLSRQPQRPGALELFVQSMHFCEDPFGCQWFHWFKPYYGTINYFGMAINTICIFEIQTKVRKSYLGSNTARDPWMNTSSPIFSSGPCLCSMVCICWKNALITNEVITLLIPRTPKT